MFMFMFIVYYWHKHYLDFHENPVNRMQIDVFVFSVSVACALKVGLCACACTRGMSTFRARPTSQSSCVDTEYFVKNARGKARLSCLHKMEGLTIAFHEGAITYRTTCRF